MKPIILIIIDSLSWKPLKAHLDKLPALKYIIENYKYGNMLNDLKPPKGWDDPIVLTSFCSATSLWTGKTPEEHKMLTSAWYKCVCPNQNPEHIKPDFKREDIKAKFLWELISNSVALHTLLFPMINWNCELKGPIWDMENKIRFPYEGKARFSFPAKITMLLTKKSVKLLTEKKPNFFTCGLYGLDTPSHYNWVAPKFEELYQCYKVLDDYLMAIIPFLKNSWFMITTQHGMDDWFIVTKRRGGRPMGREGIHGDHDEKCPFFTNMDKPKSILDVFPIIVKYAKKEGMFVVPYIKKTLRPPFDIAVEMAINKKYSYAIAQILRSVEYMKPEVLDGCLNYVFTQMLRKTKILIEVVPIIDVVLHHIFWYDPKYIKFERCKGLLGSMMVEYERRDWNRADSVVIVLNMLIDRNDKLQAEYEDQKILENSDLD